MQLAIVAFSITGMADDSLKIVRHIDNDVARNVWLRINAFLSLKSANTQITYRGIIAEWCHFLGAETETKRSAELLMQATDLHAIAYRKWLEGQPGQRPRYQMSSSSVRDVALYSGQKKRRDGLQATQANATIAKKITVLHRLYRMLIAANIGFSANPFEPDNVPAPSAKSGQKRPTEMLDFSLVEKVLNQPDLTTPAGVRDRAILALLFGGGLRRSEVTSLRICDVRRSQMGTLYLRLRATKNKKDADHAIAPWTAEALEPLLELRLSEGAAAGDPLFVSYRGPNAFHHAKVQLTPSGLYKLFKRYCMAAGAGDFITPHSARATAITKLLADGVAHREVQEFSRHSSIQMVEVYDKRRYSIEQSPAKALNFGRSRRS